MQILFEISIACGPVKPEKAMCWCLQARLGGEPTRMAQIQAFLRLRMADAGLLDFDTQGGGGTDTTWPTIFYCLRCGYHSEALQVCPLPLCPFLDHM